MDGPEKNIILLPDDALPAICELTGDLQKLAEIIGLALPRILSGRQIPAGAEISLALVIGQYFCGTPIRCWGVSKWLLKYRNTKIRRDSDAGMTGIELARKYRLSDRQVWNILGQPAQSSDQQMKLWG